MITLTKKVPSEILTKANAKKQRKKPRIDVIGIITMAVTLVSFIAAITVSGSVATNLIGFLVPLVIGVVFLIIFIIVEKHVRSPLVNLKLVFHPVIFTGNIMMLMFGILQYFVITGIPRLGSSATIWPRTGSYSRRFTTVSLWTVSDDLWTGFWNNGSQKNRT